MISCESSIMHQKVYGWFWYQIKRRVLQNLGLKYQWSFFLQNLMVAVCTRMFFFSATGFSCVKQHTQNQIKTYPLSLHFYACSQYFYFCIVLRQISRRFTQENAKCIFFADYEFCYLNDDRVNRNIRGNTCYLTSQQHMHGRFAYQINFHFLMLTNDLSLSSFL